jgi:hypothetical protein
VLRTRKRLRTLVLAAAAILAVLAAFAFLWRTPGDPSLFPPRSNEVGVTVYVVDNGFHANLVVPRALLSARAGPTAAAASMIGPGPFVIVGWGDRRFYREEGASLRRALDGLRALFWPFNPSAVMLEPLRASPDVVWRDGVTPVRLSRAGFERLAERLDRSFSLSEGRPQPLGPANEDGARFFASPEHFSVLHLCNHWTAQLLSAAGLPMRPLMATLPAGLVAGLEADGAVVHRGDRQGAP